MPHLREVDWKSVCKKRILLHFKIKYYYYLKYDLQVCNLILNKLLNPETIVKYNKYDFKRNFEKSDKRNLWVFMKMYDNKLFDYFLKNRIENFNLNYCQKIMVHIYEKQYLDNKIDDFTLNYLTINFKEKQFENFVKEWDKYLFYKNEEKFNENFKKQKYACSKLLKDNIVKTKFQKLFMFHMEFKLFTFIYNNKKYVK